MWEKEDINPVEFETLYACFRASITKFDCGEKCAPYNENGVPFCCDPHHAVPTLYNEEWVYLQNSSDLWHLWQGENEGETVRLKEQTPDGQVLAGCAGADACQRSYRSITCRAFPFFPYITDQGMFIGLSYYWEYEDRCWVLSNLNQVTPTYVQEFVDLYDELFEHKPSEKENFRNFSSLMGRIFRRGNRAIPLLHRRGGFYKITPKNGRMRKVSMEHLPGFGPYKIAKYLPFPDEQDE